MLPQCIADLSLLETRAVASAMTWARRRWHHPAYVLADMQQEAYIAVLLARPRINAASTLLEQQSYYTQRARGGIIDGLRQVLLQDGRSRTGSKMPGEGYQPARLVSSSVEDEGGRTIENATANDACPLGDLIVKRALEAIAKMRFPLPEVAYMTIDGASGQDIGLKLGVDGSMVSRHRNTLARLLRKHL